MSGSNGGRPKKTRARADPCEARVTGSKTRDQAMGGGRWTRTHARRNSRNRVRALVERVIGLKSIIRQYKINVNTSALLCIETIYFYSVSCRKAQFNLQARCGRVIARIGQGQGGIMQTGHGSNQ